jgi:uncharacterized ubiquitin-like protein YukD
VVVAALEVVLTVPMVNTNIQILAANVLIVVQPHLVAVLIAHLANINMNLVKVNALIVDLLHTEVVRIVHLESMNIKIMGKVVSQLNSNHHKITNFYVTNN